MDLTTLTGDHVWKILYLITILAFMIERALAVVFEHRLWLNWIGRFRGLKEFVTILAAWKITSWAHFDALALLVGQPSVGRSRLVTALIVAGGSKGAVRLMQEYLDIRKPETRILAQKKAAGKL